MACHVFFSYNCKVTIIICCNLSKFLYSVALWYPVIVTVYSALHFHSVTNLPVTMALESIQPHCNYCTNTTHTEMSVHGQVLIHLIQSGEMGQREEYIFARGF